MLNEYLEFGKLLQTWLLSATDFLMETGLTDPPTRKVFVPVGRHPKTKFKKPK